MRDLVNGWPVWAAFVVLALGAFVRGAATYSVGRGLRRAGSSRSSIAQHLDGPTMARAQTWIARWGAPVVALGFLTVGVQSAINAAAGVLRMPLRRYVPALVVGALLWATLYLSVGLTVVEVLLGRIPWWWALSGVMILLGLATVSRHLRRRVRGVGYGREHE